MGNSVSRIRQKALKDDTELHEYGDSTPLTGGDFSKPRKRERTKPVIYGTLIAMSLVFLVLNTIQIILIYELNSYWWTMIVPGIIFLGFTLLLTYQWIHYDIVRQFRDLSRPRWNTVLPKIGIVATVFLNIIAVEFGYLNAVAVPAAHDKLWSSSLTSHDSLPPPAMALAQDSWFSGRAILANNTADQLDRLYTSQIHGTPSNQAAFTNYSSFAEPPPPGAQSLPGGQFLNYVLFNGSLPSGKNLTAMDDLNLAYKFYWNDTTDEASLGFLLFDPKFLNQGLFELAFNCGIINGDLFSAYSRSQLSVEQIVIDDEVNAIDYSAHREECRRAEFRKYTTYRPLLIPYGPPIDPTGCGVSDALLPSDPDSPEPCTGFIDLQFSTMLVATETSKYSRDRIQMLTDEGGIIGGIMFITWFLSIVNQ